MFLLHLEERKTFQNPKFCKTCFTSKKYFHLFFQFIKCPHQLLKQLKLTIAYNWFQSINPILSITTDSLMWSRIWLLFPWCPFSMRWTESESNPLSGSLQRREIANRATNSKEQAPNTIVISRWDKLTTTAAKTGYKPINQWKINLSPKVKSTWCTFLKPINS